MNVKRRRWVYGAIGALIVAVLVPAFIPDPIPVEKVAVARAPMQVTVDSRGLTRVRDRYLVASPVTGRLERLELREGDPVKQGEVIARLSAPSADPRQAQEIGARVAAARAALREAEAQVARTAAARDLAARELARIERLVAQGVSASEELDRARNADVAARKELESARFRVASAQSQLRAEEAGLMTIGQQGRSQDIEVRAPVSGRVFGIPERSGRLVQAGQTIVTLGDALHLELVIDVLSEDAVRIRAGDPVIIEEWGGDTPLHGKVRLVEPAAYLKISALGIEEQRVNVIADLADAPPQLGDQYRVEARVVVWSSQAALQIPVIALFRQGQQWAVFAVENGRARLRIVSVGHRSDTTAEILSGLREGERVIVHPADEIEDGTRVR